MPDEDKLVEELVAEIRIYLARHPDAADTQEGIVQWWIVHSRFLHGIEAVGRALDQLVADGRMEIIQTPDGRLLYRAAQRSQGTGPASPPDIGHPPSDPDLGPATD